MSETFILREQEQLWRKPKISVGTRYNERDGTVKGSQGAQQYLFGGKSGYFHFDRRGNFLRIPCFIQYFKQLTIRNAACSILDNLKTINGSAVDWVQKDARLHRFGGYALRSRNLAASCCSLNQLIACG